MVPAGIPQREHSNGTRSRCGDTFPPHGECTCSRFSKLFIHYFALSEAIDELVDAEGFHVLVSSDEMTCTQAIDGYSKRDCVEKSFRALKTNTGMDALRGHSNAADDGRFFILFAASILRAVIFHRAQKLRVNDRKNFTFSAIVKELNKIEAVVSYKTGTYNRRYKLTARQKDILSCAGLNESSVDDFIATI